MIQNTTGGKEREKQNITTQPNKRNKQQMIKLMVRMDNGHVGCQDFFFILEDLYSKQHFTLMPGRMRWEEMKTGTEFFTRGDAW
jgi:hypothetical protein